MQQRCKALPGSQDPSHVAVELDLETIEEVTGVLGVANEHCIQIQLILLNAGVELAAALTRWKVTDSRSLDRCQHLLWAMLQDVEVS